MSTKDPLVEPFISALLDNAKESRGSVDYNRMNDRLDKLFSLYEKGIISKERITTVLETVMASESYQRSDVSKVVDKIVTRVLLE